MREAFEQIAVYFKNGLQLKQNGLIDVPAFKGWGYDKKTLKKRTI